MRTLYLISIIVFISLSGCNDLEINVPSNINVTTNTAQNGMIQGIVVIPTIENNMLVQKGIKGAIVEVLNTNFSITTSDNGIYAIDGIPTGSYTIMAKWSNSLIYESATQSVIVTRQSISTVPDIELKVGKGKIVIYGKAYKIDKVTPFANKSIDFVDARVATMANTTTGSDGSFGFDVNYGSDDFYNRDFRLVHRKNGLAYGFNWILSIGSKPYGVINTNAYDASVFGIPDP